MRCTIIYLESTDRYCIDCGAEIHNLQMCELNHSLMDSKESDNNKKKFFIFSSLIYLFILLGDHWYCVTVTLYSSLVS